MTKPIKHIVLYSGGIGSWATTRLLLQKVKPHNIIPVFCDVLAEDPDLYRFINETIDRFGLKLITLTDGRTPWQLFKQQKFIGNARVDICSRMLKREPFTKWLKENFKPSECYLYIGIDWSEIHRFEQARDLWLPYRVRCPLYDPPWYSKDRVFSWLAEDGIKAPKLYRLGFTHNNCSGFCIKAGQGHFAKLLKVLPDRFAEFEREEQEAREIIGSDVAVLSQMRGGKRKPLTLSKLREQLQAGSSEVDLGEIGGCGCFSQLD
jgi:3'-phosphoadenosine 5'-phosphosulfate sulfotransferase (PAPS reductase)/FAD synthetase